MKDPLEATKGRFLVLLASLALAGTAGTAAFCNREDGTSQEGTSRIDDIPATEAWAGQRDLEFLTRRINRLEARLDRYESGKHGPAADWDDPLPPDREVIQ